MKRSSPSSLSLVLSILFVVFLSLQCSDAKLEKYSEMLFFGARETQTLTIPLKLNTQQHLNWDFCHEPAALSICFRNQDTSGPQASQISMTVNGIKQSLELYQWSSTMFCGSVAPCDLLRLNRSACRANTELSFELTTTTGYASGQVVVFAQLADVSSIGQVVQTAAPLSAIMMEKSKCPGNCEATSVTNSYGSPFGLEGIQRLSDNRFTCDFSDPLQATHLLGTTIIPASDQYSELSTTGQSHISEAVLIQNGRAEVALDFQKKGINMCKEPRSVSVCLRSTDFKPGHATRVMFQVGDQSKEVSLDLLANGEKCALLSLCDLGKMLEAGCSAVTPMKVILDNASDAYGPSAMLRITYGRLDASTTPTNFTVESSSVSALAAASACPNGSCAVIAGSNRVPMTPLTITNDGRWICNGSGVPTHYTASFNLRETVSRVSIQ